MKWLGFGLGLLCLACMEDLAARDQWLVTISTDANVPQFGDRVLVEVHPEIDDSCKSCRHLTDAGSADDWPIELGVLATTQDVTIRVRLLRAALLGTHDEPGHGMLLDAAFRLPKASGVTRVSVPLTMNCFGVDVDLEAGLACNPDTGFFDALTVAGTRPSLDPGSWVGGVEHECVGQAPANMACIPGGAFLIGDATRADMSDPEDANVPERVVVVPPFFLDREELTVRDVRDLLVEHPELESPTTKLDPNVPLSQFCTYDATGANDLLPANCFSWEAAASYCAAQGKRLPTEAEWEFAAGNRGAESVYPWGSAEDVCAYAILERSIGITTKCLITQQATLDPGPIVGGGELDFTDAGCHDMAGSVSEWVADTARPYGTDCWSEIQTLVDPVCEGDGAASVRGGSFDDLGIDGRATSRRHLSKAQKSARVGVRCASD